MIKINKIEGKEEKDLLNEIGESEIHFRTYEKPAKLFKQKKVELTYITKKDVICYIDEFLKTLGNALNCNITSEIKFENNCYNVSINTKDSAILIGKEGRTINSIQLLLHQIISNLTGFNLRINVDSSNYKEKRVKRLEREISNIAKEVKYSKISAKLDPMNSYERRIVHNVVSKYRELATKSEGAEPNRFVIISYKED